MSHVTPTSDCGPHNNALNKALCMSADHIVPTAHADYFSVNSVRSLFHDVLPQVNLFLFQCDQFDHNVPIAHADYFPVNFVRSLFHAFALR